MVKFRMLFTIPKDIVDMGVQKGCHIQWQDKTSNILNYSYSIDTKINWL
jgi:hypothetical protein